jgi:GcrA cell cycle regulator
MARRTTPLREAVLDRWAENRTATEIAEATGASIDAIRAMVAAGRAEADPRAIRHRPGSPPTWSAERIARLTALWAEGRTCAEIARALGDGTTRNAVIGKVHRLQLPPRLREPRAVRPRRSASGVLIAARIRARAAAAARAAAPGSAHSGASGNRGGHRKSGPFPARAAPAASHTWPPALAGESGCGTGPAFDRPASIRPAPEARPVRLLDRGERQCGFVLGEPAGGETMMCGAPTGPGESYCDHHTEIAYAAAYPGWSADRRARFLLARARREAAETAAEAEAAPAPRRDPSEEAA